MNNLTDLNTFRKDHLVEIIYHKQGFIKWLSRKKIKQIINWLIEASREM